VLNSGKPKTSEESTTTPANSKADSSKSTPGEPAPTRK